VSTAFGGREKAWMQCNRRISMELSISDEKTKELPDTPEEVGLANAIIEGRNDDFVVEDEVFSILDGKAE